MHAQWLSSQKLMCLRLAMLCLRICNMKSAVTTHRHLYKHDIDVCSMEKLDLYCFLRAMSDDFQQSWFADETAAELGTRARKC